LCGCREELLGRAAVKSVVAGLCSAVFCNPFDVIRNTMFQRPHSTLYNNAAFLIQVRHGKVVDRSDIYIYIYIIYIYTLYIHYLFRLLIYVLTAPLA
jgi:hypothetical protein